MTSGPENITIKPKGPQIANAIFGPTLLTLYAHSHKCLYLRLANLPVSS